MKCICLDLMRDSPNFRGKNWEQSMGKLEFKRKKNKSKERKTKNHLSVLTASTLGVKNVEMILLHWADKR